MIYLFHGTSSVCVKGIKQKGLIPRALSKRSVYEGNLISDPDLIYLTDTYAIQFANLATHSLGGTPVVLRCKVDPAYLIADTDIKRPVTAEESLRTWGTCAYRGNLMPDKLYFIPQKHQEEILMRPTELYTNLRHLAFGPQLREAMDYLLQTSPRTWIYDGEEWYRSY